MERPADRREILDLHKQYSAVLAHAGAFAYGALPLFAPTYVSLFNRPDTFLKRMTAGSSMAVGGGASGNTQLDNDLFACHNQAKDLVRDGCRPHSPTAGDVSTESVLAQVTWRLAAALFEQKWTDLTLSDVAHQVRVSCKEHGDLLDDLRSGVGAVVSQFKELLNVSLVATADALQRIDRLEQQREADAEQMRTMRDAFEEQFQARMADMEEQTDKMRQQAQADVQEANEQVERMGETLRTLNAAFRQMRSDDKSVRRAEVAPWLVHWCNGC